MSTTLLAVQFLNGLQLGVLLFLVAAGLTLVFGVMDFINLAHGVQYMIGAFLAAWFAQMTGSPMLAILLVLPATLVLGLALEIIVFRPLYARDHLTQVLATFGIILFVNEAVKFRIGPGGIRADAAPLSMARPDWLSGSVKLMDGLQFPIHKLAIIIAGLAVAALLALLVEKSRSGMQLRAAAANAPMASALGINVNRLFMGVAGLGAMLAGFAGAMAAPIVSVEAGMGDGVLILAFVVIVIGGVGSVRGAFAGALLVGLVDTLGRSFLTDLLKLGLAPATANTVGPALASMAIYVLMATILVVRPQGLFPMPGRAS